MVNLKNWFHKWIWKWYRHQYNTEAAGCTPCLDKGGFLGGCCMWMCCVCEIFLNWKKRKKGLRLCLQVWTSCHRERIMGNGRLLVCVMWWQGWSYVIYCSIFQNFSLNEEMVHKTSRFSIQNLLKITNLFSQPSRYFLVASLLISMNQFLAKTRC